MKTLKFFAFALSIYFCAACTGNQDRTSESEQHGDENTQEQTQDSAQGPGVGAATDNSRAVPESTMQRADTSSVQPNN